MSTIVEWLNALGTEALAFLWLPLLAWTVVALTMMGMLHLWRSAHTLVQYMVRAALLLALPFGLGLAIATDWSILAFFPHTLAEATTSAAFAFSSEAVHQAVQAPGVAWSLAHTLGVLTLLAGLLALTRLGALLYHTATLRRFRKTFPVHAPASVGQAIDRQAAALGLCRKVQAVVTQQNVAPMTLGWRCPIIVVPDTLVDDAERLRMALLHELIHIRHRDALLQYAEQVIGAVFFINPAVELLRRSITQYREMACDAEVLKQPHVSSKRYAALLYSFADPQPPGPTLAVSMAAPAKQLKKRILAMKSNLPAPRRGLSPKVVGLTLATLLLGCATVIVACSDLTGPDVLADEGAAKRGDAEVFVVVEQMPELVGGLKALSEQIQYPRIAKMAGIEGRVIVQFVVDEQGAVIDPQIVRGIGAGCDEEALRVLQAATFKPGMQAGKPVGVKMSIPVTFKLSDEGNVTIGEALGRTMQVVDLQRTGTTLTGRVVAAETGQGLAGASIVTMDGAAGAATARDGTFKLILPGNQQGLRVSFVGFAPVVLRPTKDQSGFHQDVEATGEPMSEVISISLEADERMTVNGQHVALEDLTTTLASLAEGKQVIVSLKVAGDTPMGLVLDVQKAVRNAKNVASIRYHTNQS